MRGVYYMSVRSPSNNATARRYRAMSILLTRLLTLITANYAFCIGPRFIQIIKSIQIAYYNYFEWYTLHVHPSYRHIQSKYIQTLSVLRDMQVSWRHLQTRKLVAVTRLQPALASSIRAGVTSCSIQLVSSATRVNENGHSANFSDGCPFTFNCVSSRWVPVFRWGKHEGSRPRKVPRFLPLASCADASSLPALLPQFIFHLLFFSLSFSLSSLALQYKFACTLHIWPDKTVRFWQSPHCSTHRESVSLSAVYDWQDKLRTEKTLRVLKISFVMVAFYVRLFIICK